MSSGHLLPLEMSNYSLAIGHDVGKKGLGSSPQCLRYAPEPQDCVCLMYG